MGCSSSRDEPLDVSTSRSSLGSLRAQLINRRWVLDDFELKLVIGEGTFSRVRVAKPLDDQVHIPVALKILSKSDVIRLKQVEHVKSEKAILTTVVHPFIVELFGTFQDETHLYMIMEFVNGGELHNYIQKEAGCLSIEAAQFYSGEIFLALAYLHAQSIAHRDLKPSNVLIDSTGHLKLTDFGFAKQIESQTYTLVGTPEYVAPEIIKKVGHGKGVDWWAFGIVLYEILAGYTPYCGQNMEAVFSKVMEGKLEFPRKFDARAKDLVTKLLAPEHAKRIGCRKPGSADIRKHKWFKGLDWRSMMFRNLDPPFVPPVKAMDDTSMFDLYPPRDSAAVTLEADQQKLFDRFSSRLSNIELPDTKRPIYVTDGADGAETPNGDSEKKANNFSTFD